MPIIHHSFTISTTSHFFYIFYIFYIPTTPHLFLSLTPHLPSSFAPGTSMAPQPSGVHPSLALRGSDLPTGLIGEVSGTLGGCLDFRAGDFCLLIRVRQRLNNFLSTVCVGENFGTYLWIFLRKSHKAPLRNSPLHTDSAQKIVPTLPNMNRVRRQKLRPKILRPDNGPAHFPVRPVGRSDPRRAKEGCAPEKS